MDTGKIKKWTAHPAVVIFGVAVLFLLLSAGKGMEQGTFLPKVSWAVWKKHIAEDLGEAMLAQYMPFAACVQTSELQGKGSATAALFAAAEQKQLSTLLPIYRLAEKDKEILGAQIPQETVQLLQLEQLSSGTENMPKTQQTEEAQATVGENIQEESAPKEGMEEALEELMLTENSAAAIDFIPHTLQNPIDLNRWKDYEMLVQDCYTIDTNTMAGSDQLNIEKLLSKDLTLDTTGEGPQILIYHTHSQEAFADSVPQDPQTGIVGVGEYLAQILTERYGYRVLHHTGEYDVESRDDAYSKALPAIEQVLADNPTIEVVIDLHRDQMDEQTHLVTEVDGRPTARFMFFNGMSRTRKTGNIDYLYNPNLEDNLAFSFQMQLAAMEYYPGLTRKIYLKGYRYNMHLRPRNLLIELGAQNNTVEEAMNACEPIAQLLDLVLSGEERQARE